MIPPFCGAVVEVIASATAFQRARATPSDSLLVESPLPGGTAEVVRFLLNAVPPWLQMGGVLLGIVAAALIARAFVVHRAAIVAWLVARPRPVQWALAGAALVVLAGAGSAATATWGYTQHSNDFCTGCHVMNPAFQRFSGPENKHSEFSCHDCHQQSTYASMRQLYLWVAERPEKIAPHAKVPNRVCEGCHVTGDTAKWQHVAATAGHRVHLESDSSALAKVQCVTCHGLEVHRFRPVKETCGQSECHQTHETDIVLGKMATQTVQHCTSCHPFTADVSALATRDSARGSLVPGQTECMGCHQMERVLRDFVAGRDPHGGKCGACHDPHKQRTVAEAAASCASAGCHDNWRSEPFHVGDTHRRIGEQCTACHVPHRAQVDASDCAGCHVRVRSNGVRRPPVPFDTTVALRRPGFTGTGRGDVIDYDAIDAAEAIDAVVDTFPHPRHTKLACLECHQTGDGHGRLTFERPRGCAICHHQAPTPTTCGTCHRPADYGATRHVEVTVTVPNRPGRERTVDFSHERHTSRPCVECHTTPVTLALESAKAQCKDCHAEHHAADRECTACHRIADPKVEHTPVEAAHQRCDACHTPSSIERLTPTRSFCGTCHTKQATNHHDQKECTACHFLAEPAAYRPSLRSPPSS